jgi:hypothetical protein
MTNPETSRHIEVKDDNDQTAAVAAVNQENGPAGTVRASMYAKSETVRPGDRASLVDAVMDLPEVQAADRLEATVPFGDAESVERLRQRTDDAELRAAGASTLLDANVPRPRGEEPRGQQAGGEQVRGDPAGGEQAGDEQAGDEQAGDEQVPGELAAGELSDGALTGGEGLGEAGGGGQPALPPG